MRYIINADDFGRNHNKTIAIDRAFRQGFIHRASLIMNMESMEEAVALAKDGNYTDRIGFHLNLTDGTPLTEPIKNTPVCNEKGEFCRCSNKRFQRKCCRRRVILAIRQECEAQMRLFREKGFTSDHVDSHRWCHCNLPVWLAIRPLFRKYGFRTVRTMKGHMLTYEAGKLRAYYALLQRFIRFTGVSFSESWAGVSEEFLNLVVPAAGRYKGVVEVYMHPDIIDGKVQDIEFNYKYEKRPLDEIVALLAASQSAESI